MYILYITNYIAIYNAVTAESCAARFKSNLFGQPEFKFW